MMSKDGPASAVNVGEVETGVKPDKVSSNKSVQNIGSFLRIVWFCERLLAVAGPGLGP